MTYWHSILIRQYCALVNSLASTAKLQNYNYKSVGTLVGAVTIRFFSLKALHWKAYL
jgi:hypothetical protein